MPEFDAPQSRNEAILQNMLGANNELGEPQSRIEELLMELLEQGGGGFVKIKIPDSVAIQINACIGNLEAEEVSGTNWFTVDKDDEFDAFYTAITEANEAGKLAIIENDDNRVFYSQRTLYGSFGLEMLGSYEDDNHGVDIRNIFIAWGTIVVDYERRKGTEWQPSE